MNKGLALEIEKIVYLLAAIAFVLLLITLSQNLLSKAEIEKKEVEIPGGKSQALGSISKMIENCWKKGERIHEGRVCYEVKMDLEKGINESEVTQRLDCEFIPNNKCPPNDCSFCTSFKYEEDDKVEWRNLIEEGKNEIIIKYIPEKIIVEKKWRKLE